MATVKDLIKTATRTAVKTGRDEYACIRVSGTGSGIKARSYLVCIEDSRSVTDIISDDGRASMDEEAELLSYSDRSARASRIVGDTLAKYMGTGLSYKDFRGFSVIKSKSITIVLTINIE